jgi:hypothetical protein
MMAVAMRPIPGRPAQREKYDGSRDGTPRVVNRRLTQVCARPPQNNDDTVPARCRADP